MCTDVRLLFCGGFLLFVIAFSSCDRKDHQQDVHKGGNQNDSKTSSKQSQMQESTHGELFISSTDYSYEDAAGLKGAYLRYIRLPSRIVSFDSKARQVRIAVLETAELTHDSIIYRVDYPEMKTQSRVHIRFKTKAVLKETFTGLHEVSYSYGEHAPERYRIPEVINVSAYSQQTNRFDTLVASYSYVDVKGAGYFRYRNSEDGEIVLWKSDLFNLIPQE